MDKKILLADLKKSYNIPGHPVAYASQPKIYKYYNGLLTAEEIKNFLSTKDVHTLFRQYKKLKRNPTYSHFKLHQLQIDLIDISQLSGYNKGIKYLLAAIDSFSRKAYIAPLITKQAQEVLDAFENIINQAGKKPYCVYSDKGKEFNNKIWNTFMDTNKIKRFYAYTTDHAAIIERFNLTFQRMLYKFMYDYNTKQYYDSLSDILKSYNNRYHRVIKMTPEEANHDKNGYLVRLNAQKRIINLFKGKYKVKYHKGQRVRIRNWDKQFKRGYAIQSTNEIFTIKEVIKSFPKPIYKLVDKKDQYIQGYFYDFELTNVHPSRK